MRKRIAVLLFALCMLLPMLLAVPVSAEEQTIPVWVHLNGGRWTYHNELDGTSGGGSGHGFELKPGQSLADIGIVMDTFTYWTDRAFLGWEVLELVPEYDDNGELIDYHYGRVEGTDLMTTEEIFQFKVPADVLELEFSAVWEGSDWDYYSFVDIDPFAPGATITITTEQYGEVNVGEYESYSQRMEENGLTLKENWHVTDFKEPVWEGHVFEGWVMTYSDAGIKLCSRKIYTTEEMLNMVVPEEDVIFLAKWDFIDIDDYAAIKDSMAAGEYSFFPNDAVVTDMVLDQKYSMNVEGMPCFQFVAPATGAYCISTDSVAEYFCNVTVGGHWIDSEFGQYIYLEKGQKLKLYNWSGIEANIWISQTESVTELTIVSKDENYRVLDTDSLWTEALVRHVVLEATFSDGTKVQYDLADGFGLDGRDINVKYRRNNGVVTVTITCETAKVSYTIPTVKEKITKFEVIPAEGVMLYPGIDGYMESDIYYYNMEKILFGATYRFTWSDGTVETLTYDDVCSDYYGCGIAYIDRQWEEPWSAGVNKLEILFCDLTAVIDVEVAAESPVKSIKYTPKRDTFYYGDPKYYDKDEQGYYLCYILSYDDVFTVNYKDGTSVSYTMLELEAMNFQIDFSYLNWWCDDWDQAYQQSGSITVTFEGLGEQYNFDLQILPTDKLSGWEKIDGQWAFVENGKFVTDEWVKDGSQWCYLAEDGRLVTNNWAKDGNVLRWMNASGYITYSQWVYDDYGWSYINSKGYMDTNKWVKDGSKWAYVGADGYMVKNQWVKDGSYWCYLDKTGHMLTNGWAKDGSLWRWMNSSGYITYSQWIHDGYGWCYINSKGAMETNKWVKDGAYWAYVGADGYMVKNQWVKDGSQWCYIGKTGHMVTNGWAKDGGLWRWMNSSGYITYSKWIHDGYGWCYINSKGAMETTEWVKDGKYWAYVGADGYMATNKWIDNGSTWSYVDANGHALTGTHTIGGKKYTFDANGNLIG